MPLNNVGILYIHLHKRKWQRVKSEVKLNGSSDTIANSVESVANSRRIWYDQLGKLEEYQGNRLATCYIKFTALNLLTSSKRNTFVLL